MTIRLKLKPGQKGTKKLLAIYGEDLVCVRYRYDVDTGMRIKTAEIVVERKSWTPPALQFGADEMVPVRIQVVEKVLQRMARSVGGVWDAKAKVWRVRYGEILGTELEKHIVLDADSSEPGSKSI
jgi:hypothetical protein